MVTPLPQGASNPWRPCLLSFFEILHRLQLGHGTSDFHHLPFSGILLKQQQHVVDNHTHRDLRVTMAISTAYWSSEHLFYVWRNHQCKPSFFLKTDVCMFWCCVEMNGRRLVRIGISCVHCKFLKNWKLYKCLMAVLLVLYCQCSNRRAWNTSTQNCLWQNLEMLFERTSSMLQQYPDSGY